MSESGKGKVITKDLVLLFIFSIGICSLMNMFNVIVPLYVTDTLGAGTSMVGIMTTLYIASSCVSRPLNSAVTDRIGRKKVMILGSLLFAIASVAGGLIPSLVVLGICRVFMGIGYSAGSTACNTASTDIIPKEKMASGIGYFGISQSVASAFGPPLATAIIAWAAGRFGWISGEGFSFLSVAAVGIISMIIALFINYEKKPGYVRPVITGEKVSLKEQMIEKTAFKASIFEFVTLFFVTCVMNYITLYAVDLGLNANVAGMFFLISSVLIVLIRTFLSHLMEKLPVYAFTIPGYAALLAACLILPHIHSAWGVYLIAFLYGIEHGVVWMALGSEAVRMAPPEKRGTANATFYIAFDAAIGIGALVWGFLIDAWGYHTCYYIVAVASVILAVLSVVLFRRKKK